MKKYALLLFAICVISDISFSQSCNHLEEETLKQTVPKIISPEDLYKLIQRETTSLVVANSRYWRYERIQQFPYPTEKPFLFKTKISLKKEDGTSLRSWHTEDFLFAEYPPSINKWGIVWILCSCIITFLFIKSLPPLFTIYREENFKKPLYQIFGDIVCVLIIPVGIALVCSIVYWFFSSVGNRNVINKNLSLVFWSQTTAIYGWTCITVLISLCIKIYKQIKL